MTAELSAQLRLQVRAMEDDLRQRVDQQPDVLAAWQSEHKRAIACERTAAGWSAWRDERVTQAAVAWVLTTVFVRFCEDNALLRPVWIAGPEARRPEALDAQLAYFRQHPEHTDREWLQQAIDYLGSLPATRALVDSHAALGLVSPSGDAAAALLAFWRERGEDGRLRRGLTDPDLSTRFLGDLYQDMSISAQKTYALLQTPVFVEEFILDRTLEPALAERPLDGFALIDPACGSGHFLLGAFTRLLDRWHRHAPALDSRVRVQKALDAIHGVDANPFAVAIARFRLTLAALQASGLRSLEEAPAFAYHLATGDSLIHGAEQLALDFGPDDPATQVTRFAYSTEDLPALQAILKPGRYDVVVGNPPYITVKDKALNATYRKLYATCSGKYALTVPFMERFFQLASPGADARPAGWVGQITSNSFMKREFGEPLIKDFLAKQDLRLVADTSGAYIPGHGTPTVIIIGRNQRPVGSTVRAVLGIRGEPGRPDAPAKGIVWRSITEHVDDPGHDDGWTSTADLDRTLLAKHPWSLSGGGAIEVMKALNDAGRPRLADRIARIGFFGIMGADDAMVCRDDLIKSRTLEASAYRPLVVGDAVRDHLIIGAQPTWFPYDDAHELGALDKFPGTARHLWPMRTELGGRPTFAGATYVSEGRPWYEWHQLPKDRGASLLSITFAEVATHNHFVLDRGGKVFKQTAPVIKLPEGASDDDHLALLGVLNSSTTCFWLKQTCFDKGNGGIGGGIGDEPWERRYAFNGANVADFPVPGSLPLERGRLLDSLARDLSEHTPDAIASKGIPSRQAFDAAHAEYDRIRTEMIAQQEELDWEVYRLYGLITDDLTYAGDDLPDMALGERAFEVALARKVKAGEEQTAWFERHGSTPITEIPEHWPATYRNLMQRRLDLIAADLSVRLLEKPEHKRRWSSESWAKQEERAIRGWLLDRLEDKRFWFDGQGRPAPRSIAQLADDVAREPDLTSVLVLWEGRPDVPITQSLTKLLADEAVPYLAAYRYKDSGLRKRADWEHTWALQRREDAGEKLDASIPVPPKYTSADFAKPAYWKHRGKLDVPKERFVAYPSAGRDTDPTLVLGWAGWDHAQQSLALSTLIALREQDGWDDTRLTPLVAGLAELQPWVEQWHAALDPTFGVSLGAFCREQLTERSRQVGKITEELAAWRPEKTRVAGRGRKNGTSQRAEQRLLIGGTQ